MIARSSRIEAASLEGSREEFLSFTGEASKLAAVVQSSIGDIAREHEELAGAIAAALREQQAFERRYRGPTGLQLQARWTNHGPNCPNVIARSGATKRSPTSGGRLLSCARNYKHNH